MQLDFFKDGNELKQKSKEELVKEIIECEKRNKEIINDLKSKEDTFLKNNLNKLNSFLTEDLSFVLSTYKDDKIYEFLKNQVEYKITLNSCFLSYHNHNKKTTYAYTINYRDDNTEFKRLNQDEYLERQFSYSPYSNMDISQCLKQYEYSKQILEKNIKSYNEIKELPLEDLFIVSVKESGASISKCDKNVKRYNDFIEFVKDIL